MNMTREDISELLFLSDFRASDINDVVNMVYYAGLLPYGKRNDYLKRHIKTNGVPKTIRQASDGRYYTYFGRKMIKRNTREKVINEVIKKYGGANQMEHNIEEVYKEWLALKTEEGDIKPSTVNRYEVDFQRYFKKEADYVKEFVNKPIQLITALDIEHFIKMSIKSEELTAKSYSNLRLLLRGIFIYARKKHYTGIDINSFFGTLMLSRNTFRKNIRQASDLVFNEEEIAIIKDYILTDFCNIRSLCVLLAFQTGLRPGELVSLKWEDIEGDILSVRRTEILHREKGHNKREIQEHTKGSKGFRDVILSSGALETLARVAKITGGPKQGFIFVEKKKRKQIRIHALMPTWCLENICKTLGINKRSLNKARKTYASYLKASGVPDSLIEEQMGHTSIATTEMYYIYNTSTKTQARDMINNAIRF